MHQIHAQFILQYTYEQWCSSSVYAVGIRYVHVGSGAYTFAKEPYKRDDILQRDL